MRPDTFGRVAVKKLSTQRTSSPRASSRSHRWEPMNPAPPVTRTRRLLNICLPHHSQELYNILEVIQHSSWRKLYTSWRRPLSFRDDFKEYSMVTRLEAHHLHTRSSQWK